MGKLETDPNDVVKPVAVTVFPSTNSSTNACLPAQQVSAHESLPNRQPSWCSLVFKIGWRKESIACAAVEVFAIIVVKAEIDFLIGFVVNRKCKSTNSVTKNKNSWRKSQANLFPLVSK